jgi:hypothetical protein
LDGEGDVCENGDVAVLLVHVQYRKRRPGPSDMAEMLASGTISHRGFTGGAALDRL